MQLAAEIVGFLGLVCSLISFQQKERKMVMLFQLTASALCCLALFLAGSVIGGALDLISFVRTTVFAIFMNSTKKWASSPVWLWLFIVALVVTGIFTWQNAWSILPILGSVLSTVALWMKKASHIRAVSLFVGPCWMIYNLVEGTVAGAMNELMAMTSIVIGMLRHDRKQKTT
jgi:hypothetical protein